MKNKLLVGLVTTLFLVGIVGVAAANLIENGDFSDDLNGWKVLNSANFTIKDGWGPYEDHVQFLTGGTGQRGRLIQNFDIPLSATGLHVSFDWQSSFGESGNGDPWDPNIDPSSFFKALVNVDLDSAGLFKYSNSELILKTNETTRWTHVDMTFLFNGTPTDTSPNGRIRFEFNEVNDWMSNAKLDNININPIPEPTTMLLFGTGLAGLVGLRRRKK